VVCADLQSSCRKTSASALLRTAYTNTDRVYQATFLVTDGSAPTLEYGNWYARRIRLPALWTYQVRMSEDAARSSGRLLPLRAAAQTSASTPGTAA
jgi:hypothetical protein